MQNWRSFGVIGGRGCWCVAVASCVVVGVVLLACWRVVAVARLVGVLLLLLLSLLVCCCCRRRDLLMYCCCGDVWSPATA